MRTSEGVEVSDLCEYLHAKSLDVSWLDDECGSVDEGGWFGRIGRHVIWVSPMGFKYHSAFASEAEAEADMQRLHAECALFDENESCHEWPEDECELCGRSGHSFRSCPIRDDV